VKISASDKSESSRQWRCPLHGWEFDLATGRSVFDPTRTRVKSYPVEIDREQFVVLT
jgi:nitrite reductase/ring-hydroxylating ferredoxin subunit